MNAASIGQRAEAEVMLSGALRNLFAVAESYPDLKANESFLQLQSRISELRTTSPTGASSSTTL